MATKPDRKKIKPFIEKRRRSRINHSLAELKSLVLNQTDRETTKYAKLEKADILEMVVDYIKTANRIRAAENSRLNLSRYQRGFYHCALEIARYLRANKDVGRTVKENIMARLNYCYGNAFPGRQMSPEVLTHAPIETFCAPESMLLADKVDGPAPNRNLSIYTRPLLGYIPVPCPVAFIVTQNSSVVQSNNHSSPCHEVRPQPTEAPNQSTSRTPLHFWRPWERTMQKDTR